MESIWTQTCDIKPRKRLDQNLQTEIAVIGAGIAGILIAFELQQAGKKVVVLEANRIASGQTKNTTAKITSQHGLIYHTLLEQFGEKKAAQYALANQTALKEYHRFIADCNIDCDFEPTDAYVYSADMELLQKEASAATQLGLPAEITDNVPLPFLNTGAVVFRDQAQFHPLKFIKAIADKLTIYENTAVQTIDGDHKITTLGGVVTADKIVFACHYPFVNFPGLYFARMHQQRSYVLALKNVPPFEGVFIGADENSYSLRRYKDFTLLGGENHRTGKNHTPCRYDSLRKKAKEWFTESSEVACWSAQDCITPDQVPYIGQYAASKPDWYVATGFQKWGMSTAMAASLILRDQICGQSNDFSEIFDPGRFAAEDIPQIAVEGGQAVKGLAKQIFRIPEKAASELAPGHGGIVFLDGKKIGVYKDDNGKIHAVDTRCPHLGCQLEWNPDELSWDCPCHGSRFDYHGKLISNPAQEDISLEPANL